MKRYVETFGILKSRELPLSPLEIFQFGIEFSRLVDLHQLYRRGSCEFATALDAQGVYGYFKRIVDTGLPYTTDSHAQFMEELYVSHFIERSILEPTYRYTYQFLSSKLSKVIFYSNVFRMVGIGQRFEIKFQIRSERTAPSGFQGNVSPCNELVQVSLWVHLRRW